MGCLRLGSLLLSLLFGLLLRFRSGNDMARSSNNFIRMGWMWVHSTPIMSIKGAYCSTWLRKFPWEPFHTSRTSNSRRNTNRILFRFALNVTFRPLNIVFRVSHHRVRNTECLLFDLIEVCLSHIFHVDLCVTWGKLTRVLGWCARLYLLRQSFILKR